MVGGQPFNKTGASSRRPSRSVRPAPDSPSRLAAVEATDSRLVVWLTTFLGLQLLSRQGSAIERGQELSERAVAVARRLGNDRELGWALATRIHGKGYATEAVRAAVAWGERHFVAGTRTSSKVLEKKTESVRDALALYSQTSYIYAVPLVHQPCVFCRRTVTPGMLASMSRRETPFMPAPPVRTAVVKDGQMVVQAGCGSVCTSRLRGPA